VKSLFLDGDVLVSGNQVEKAPGSWCRYYNEVLDLFVRNRFLYQVPYPVQYFTVVSARGEQIFYLIFKDR